MPQGDFSSLSARIAVTGAGGQLGSQLCRVLGPRAIPLDLPRFDLASATRAPRQIVQLRPHVLINTAAYTAVDRAEDEPQGCFEINARAVQRLAQATAEIDCLLVQLSTDYLFGDPSPPDRPYREDDPPRPQGVYARSKWEGERAARRNPRHLIVRTCGLYGTPGPTASSNFVTTMLRLGRQKPQVAVVHDQLCCPTWVVELADAIVWLITEGHLGTFHIVNGGGTSWFHFAQMIFALSRINCTVVPITTEQYGASAPRPAHSVLDASKYAGTGGPTMSSCEDALGKFLRQLGPPDVDSRA